jgi:hypothetical protein
MIYHEIQKFNKTLFQANRYYCICFVVEDFRWKTTAASTTPCFCSNLERESIRLGDLFDPEVRKKAQEDEKIDC